MPIIMHLTRQYAVLILEIPYINSDHLENVQLKHWCLLYEIYVYVIVATIEVIDLWQLLSLALTAVG